MLRLWWKGILPTMCAIMLVIELYAGGCWLMNQPQDWAVFGGSLMLTSIVVVMWGWVVWIRKSFFQEK